MRTKTAKDLRRFDVVVLGDDVMRVSVITARPTGKYSIIFTDPDDPRRFIPNCDVRILKVHKDELFKYLGREVPKELRRTSK